MKKKEIQQAGCTIEWSLVWSGADENGDGDLVTVRSSFGMEQQKFEFLALVPENGSPGLMTEFPSFRASGVVGIGSRRPLPLVAGTAIPRSETPPMTSARGMCQRLLSHHYQRHLYHNGKVD